MTSSAFFEAMSDLSLAYVSPTQGTVGASSTEYWLKIVYMDTSWSWQLECARPGFTKVDDGGGPVGRYTPDVHGR